ncbi:hypothetical protein [Actinocorallia libanotica]|uniref:Uncharacterized protein n=1 Tax=Actinocorallia libanotica TaxID=46162 RepID=A0ABN1Q1P0_9ACTN
MANGHGGKRTPRKPAPVSGPGALSKRTDGGPQARRQLPDAQYGEQAAFQDAQASAPMAGDSQAGPGAPAQGRPPVEVVPFGAPSMRPDEPVTAGVDIGAGPGSTSLGFPDPNERVNQQDMEQMRVMLPYLEWMSSLPNASPSTRAIVRRIKGML